MSLLGATLAVFIAVAPTQTVSNDAAIRSAVNYCLLVAEAKLSGAPPVLDGPIGFDEERGAYGALAWTRGEPRSSGSIRVSPGDRMCTIVAKDGQQDVLRAIFAERDGYRSVGETGTAFFRRADGGWIQVGWSDQALSHATMVIVQAIEGTD